MLRRISTIGGMTLLSRLFGFLRDMMMAAVLGAGPLADAFMVAFRLPNHFRAIFGEGAFNAAFVPTYSSLAETGPAPSAARFAGQVLSLLALSQLLLLALAWLFTPLLVQLLAPGFAAKGAIFEQTVALTRITFPYLGLITLVTLISGMLNAHDRFASAAFAPTLLNLAMIGALLQAGRFPSAADALAWAVLLAGGLQLVLVWADLRRTGVPLRFVRPARSAALASFFRRFGPAVLGSAGTQIALFADTIIASLLPTGSVSYLYYADRLYQLPLAIIGIAIGTAILPELSRLVAGGLEDQARRRLTRAMLLGLALTLPCALAFWLLGGEIMHVLFGRGAFDAKAVAGSAGALAAYALGLPAFVLLRSVVPAFHARGDTTTPMLVLFGAVAVNVVLKLLLTGPFLHVGLAAATSVGAWTNFLVLALILLRRQQLRLDRGLVTGVLVTATGLALMALALLASEPLLAGWQAASLPAAALKLGLLGSIGLAAYALPFALPPVRRRLRA